MSEQVRKKDEGRGAPSYTVRVELVRDAPAARPKTIRSAEEVFALVREEALRWDREHFLVLLLDGRNRLLGINEVAVGTLTSALVHPRELFKAAILANAANVICVHNHPSGDPEPSQEDRALTKRLSEAGELLGIRLLDHVVVAASGFRSLAEAGLC